MVDYLTSFHHATSAPPFTERGFFSNEAAGSVRSRRPAAYPRVAREVRVFRRGFIIAALVGCPRDVCRVPDERMHALKMYSKMIRRERAPWPLPQQNRRPNPH